MDDPFVALGLVLALVIAALVLVGILRSRPGVEEHARAEALRVWLLEELNRGHQDWPAYEVATTPVRTVAQVVNLARPCRIWLSPELLEELGLDEGRAS